MLSEAKHQVAPGIPREIAEMLRSLILRLAQDGDSFGFGEKCTFNPQCEHRVSSPSITDINGRRPESNFGS
jgi:hypothetical protein